MKETLVQLPTGMKASNAAPVKPAQAAAAAAAATARPTSATAAAAKTTPAANNNPTKPKQQSPIKPVVAAESENATYNGSLAVRNAKSNSVRRVEEVLSPASARAEYKHEAAHLLPQDLPPLPLKEGTSLEAFLHDLTEQNWKQTKAAPAATSSSKPAKTSNLSGPRPVARPQVPTFPSSYAHVAKLNQGDMMIGYGLRLEEFGDSLAIYAAIHNQTANEALWAAERKHRSRDRAHRDMTTWTNSGDYNLQGTKHLHDLHSAYRERCDMDLRGTFFQTTTMKTTPRVRDGGFVELASTFMSQAPHVRTRPKYGLDEKYLQNSFMLSVGA